ncbi:PaaI family thioesterase [Sneathiella litorea]|uniref:Hotdog fold thioesterase n=1 Tax=Sneathiella litorea TaxID=2606216 RepID=A0A6L8W6T8_9PROT|nr:PaaI family thioesterase [Sneathiella litorea]MZR30845.1 hotdog fold thioesterase [Sneathiella litorea]
MTKTELTQYLHDRMPLCATLGMKAEKMSPEEVVLTLDWTPTLCTSAGILHGGVIMALADSAGGAAAFANLPEGATGTSTIESKTNFLGAVREGTITATAKPLHIGRSTIVIETEVRNDAGKLVGKITQTQTVLRPRN